MATCASQLLRGSCKRGELSTNIGIIRQRIHTQLGEGFRVLDIFEKCLTTPAIVSTPLMKDSDPIRSLVLGQQECLPHTDKSAQCGDLSGEGRMAHLPAHGAQAGGAWAGGAIVSHSTLEIGQATAMGLSCPPPRPTRWLGWVLVRTAKTAVRRGDGLEFLDGYHCSVCRREAL